MRKPYAVAPVLLFLLCAKWAAAARRGPRPVLALTVSLALFAAGADAGAADGKLIAECIRKVASSGFAMGGNAEVIGVIACTGISPGKGTGAAEGGVANPGDFDEKVRRISKCISKVSFRSDTQGDVAEAIGAVACVGVVDPDATVACLREVSRTLQYAKDLDAELLAARACANGNLAKETAACVQYVASRLDADGLAAETLAVQACGK